MQTWEYCMLAVGKYKNEEWLFAAHRAGSEIENMKGSSIVEMFAMLGLEGWELVIGESIGVSEENVDVLGSSGKRYVFKRPSES